MPGGRPQRGPVKLTEKIHFRSTPAEKKALDAQRGTRTRSDYLRALIVRDGKKQADDAR